VYLFVSLLLGHLRAHHHDFPVFRVMRRSLIVTFSAAILLAIVGWAIREMQPDGPAAVVLPQGSVPSNALSTTNEAQISGTRATRMLHELWMQLPSILHASRPLLLGSRDPNGPSCVRVMTTGQVHNAPPDNPVDLDGGPGTKVTTLILMDRQIVKNAQQDYL